MKFLTYAFFLRGLTLIFLKKSNMIWCSYFSGFLQVISECLLSLSPGFVCPLLFSAFSQFCSCLLCLLQLSFSTVYLHVLTCPLLGVHWGDIFLLEGSNCLSTESTNHQDSQASFFPDAQKCVSFLPGVFFLLQVFAGALEYKWGQSSSQTAKYWLLLMDFTLIYPEIWLPTWIRCSQMWGGRCCLTYSGCITSYRQTHLPQVSVLQPTSQTGPVLGWCELSGAATWECQTDWWLWIQQKRRYSVSFP